MKSGRCPCKCRFKLLRVLQELEFFPIGAEKPVWVDIRVIAATNKNLEEEVEKGTFRKDLYYRLGVITLTLPPLRNRKEDIPSMANHFLTMYKQKIGRTIKQFSPKAMEALIAYHWPGNIRELMNVIERAILLCKSDTISIDDLPNIFQQQLPLELTAGTDGILKDMESWEGKTLPQVRDAMIAWVEKQYLEMVLKKTGGKIGETAAIAGIHTRGLYDKMRKLGIDKADFK